MAPTFRIAVIQICVEVIPVAAVCPYTMSNWPASQLQVTQTNAYQPLRPAENFARAVKSVRGPSAQGYHSEQPVKPTRT